MTMHVSARNMTLKCYIFATYNNLSYVQISDNYVSVNTSYELTTINNMTTGTGIDTFNIIDICP